MLSWRIDLEDLPWNYFLTQVCIGFSSELHFLCHFIFHFFINEKCLFITSIHLLPFVPSFYIAALKNYITFHPTYNVWAISLLFFFLPFYFVNLQTKCVMGKYIEYVFLLKFVLVTFKRGGQQTECGLKGFGIVSLKNVALNLIICFNPNFGNPKRNQIIMY